MDNTFTMKNQEYTVDDIAFSTNASGKTGQPQAKE